MIIQRIITPKQIKTLKQMTILKQKTTLKKMTTMKKITLLLLVFGSISTSFGQFSQGFEGGTTAPPGWSVINGGDANTFYFHNQATAAHSGTNAARIDYSATAHDDYLVTPQITVTAGVNDRLTYYVLSQDVAPYIEAYEVRMSTTIGTSASAFTQVLTPIANAPTSWTQFTIDLTPYIGQSVYVGFHAVSADKWRLIFDDVVSDSAGLGTDTFESSNLKYYPNPVENVLNLSFDQEISSVEIFNLLGQKVSSTITNAANEVQVDMSNLANGPYMVRVISNDKMKTIKVIKE
jgi:hypothetical protein